MDPKPLVLLTEPVDDAAVLLLQEVAHLRTLNSSSEEELVREVVGVDAILNRLSATLISERVLEAAPRLRIVARHGAGYDNVDIDAATRLGIVVTHTPGVNANAMAEFTITMMLALSKHYVQAAQSMVGGEWTRDRFKGCELLGKTLGVVGLGRIGGKVARMAKAFGMHVTFYDPFVEPGVAAEAGVEAVASLDDLLSSADIVTIHTALTEGTKGLIDERRLHLMKPSSLLINNARGPIVDELALYRALKERRIAGAALDVFCEEPLATDSPLRQLDNVLLTPHLGTMTDETQRRTAVTAAEQIRLVLSGRPPHYPVNPEVLGRCRQA